MDGLNEAAVPGAFLVDVIPLLKYVPKWFPGAGWKRKAEEWNALRTIFLQKPFEEVKARMVCFHLWVPLDVNVDVVALYNCIGISAVRKGVMRKSRSRPSC